MQRYAAMTRISIKEFLLTYFPNKERLSYEEFTHGDGHGKNLLLYVFDSDENAQRCAFEIISSPWTEIDWLILSAIGGAGSDIWMLPSFLNKRSYIHVFPSMIYLLYNEKKYDINSNPSIGLLLECFEDQLTGRGLKCNWKRDFYLSLDNNVVKVIGRILNKNNIAADQNDSRNFWQPS
ncbi:MAG: hypothetical protein LBV29_04035 [Azoarcus sp.]|jgi:hypothetical protein|nr:hypothetical protein [Azoarcus sp.]